MLVVPTKEVEVCALLAFVAAEPTVPLNNKLAKASAVVGALPKLPVIEVIVELVALSTQLLAVVELYAVPYTWL